MNKENLTVNILMICTVIALCIGFIMNLNHENEKNIDFLKGYGWEVNPKPIEKIDITIPEIFDNVYTDYNALQIEAGLNLLPYSGFGAVRYTYSLKNFPKETKNKVRANVISVSGTPVGGDICTVAADGFMYSLNFNTQNCVSAINFKEFTP